jgi:hypothetical protein
MTTDSQLLSVAVAEACVESTKIKAYLACTWKKSHFFHKSNASEYIQNGQNLTHDQ